MTSNGVDRGTENNGGAQVKNRCLPGCNYSIRGLSVNLPHQQQVFLQRWGGDGQKWLRLDRRGTRRIPPITTHTIECLLMDKCTPCERALQHPTGYSSLSKCSDRCIDESHHRADILITWTTRSSVGYRETDGLWARSSWKNWATLFFFLKCNGGTKAKPTRWKLTPPFCWFPNKHNDNNFLTIWCLLHPPVAIQTKRSLRI